MKLEIFKTLWGHQGGIAQAIADLREAGFTGIEGPLPADADSRREFLEIISAENIPFIAEISTCTPAGLYLPERGKSPQQHLDSLEEHLVRSLTAQPLFITTMAGSDEWKFSEAIDFFTAVIALENRYQIAISCETHRGRPTFSPWQTRDLLTEIPVLKLTCDFSHWCVVSERLLLDDEPELLALAARHAFHLHGRVGYAQGPQVPDPRAPEFATELAAHERWWDEIWNSMQSRNFQNATLTPEFGPDGYLQCAPFTGIPVADLWTLNRWIGQRQQDRISRSHND